MTAGYPFGVKLGSVVIDGTEIDVFSNGACTYVSESRGFDRAGNYMGIQYQCVEFVRRYIYLRHGKNLAMLWQDGNACDWYDNRVAMGLVSVPSSEAHAGDIATFTGGKWGHVAIVSEVSQGIIYIAQQNFMNGSADIKFALDQDVLAGKKAIQDLSGNDIYFQSFLRHG